MAQATLYAAPSRVLGPCHADFPHQNVPPTARLPAKAGSCEPDLLVFLPVLGPWGPVPMQGCSLQIRVPASKTSLSIPGSLPCPQTHLLVLICIRYKSLNDGLLNSSFPIEPLPSFHVNIDKTKTNLFLRGTSYRICPCPVLSFVFSLVFSSADRPGGECISASPRRPDLCARHPADRHGAAPGEGGGEEAAADPGGPGQEPGGPQ